MATVTMQRDLVVNLKRETYSNVAILGKLQPMQADLTRLLFKENALEKPTQNVFNNLSYYLVSIIDPPVFEKFSWPLYDTKTERTYRGQLSAFINDYSSKGLVSPVMSSYLVNPGCYKVTMLIFQLSQLAVQRLLVTKMTDKQKELYNTMTERYKNSSEGFLDDIEKETHFMVSKFSNYLHKREAMEKIAAVLRNRITSMEEKLSTLKAQEYINNLVDGFLEKKNVDEAIKNELLKIKNVNAPAPFFDAWLSHADDCIKELESKWTEKVSPFLKLCSETRDSTEALIARNTGEADRKSFMVEYNHKTDEICTKDLQNHVNSQQKYILKNITRDEKLYFPNLVRGFLIAICYVLKDAEIGDDIFKFNEYLESGCRDFGEVVSAMKILNDRVLNAEATLEPSPVLFDQSSISIKEFEIPPLPDLSDLKATREHPCLLFDTFTPISMSKHQFNLRRKHNSFSYSTKNYQSLQPKSMFITPFHQGPRDDFIKSLISCRVSSYDRPDVSQNFHNLSIISQVNPRGNETIAECSGFSKQQIMRLLSTKKSSSSKKMKHKMDRPSINIKKGGLFNESMTSNESNGLFRSYSSPNLFENREKRSVARQGKRKLSIMPEDTPSLLEVSGIAALEKDNTYGTPEGVHLENTRKLVDATSLPAIIITPDPETKLKDLCADKVLDLNKIIESDSPEIQPILKEPRKSCEIKVEELKTETPKNNSQLIRKTSSLEKIINRFKKVRANVLPAESTESTDFKTIVEEKENLNTVNVDVFTANRILLPDLLSPSCSVLSIKSTDYLDQLCMEMDEKEQKKPRQSLGTALGVDNTFLDQFDLID